jgi:hypothetical protein
LGLADSAIAREEQKQAAAAAQKDYERKLGIVNEQKQELGKKINNDNALFDRLIYQDITKRADVQNMMRLLDENQKKAEKRDAARAAITGATEEQQLASKEINRKSFADALASYGSQASNIRDMYMRDKLNMGNFNFAQRLGIANQEINLNNPESAIHANTANQLATAGTNAFTASGGMLASGLGSDEFGEWVDKIKAKNNADKIFKENFHSWTKTVS